MLTLLRGVISMLRVHNIAAECIAFFAWRRGAQVLGVSFAAGIRVGERKTLCIVLHYNYCRRW